MDRDLTQQLLKDSIIRLCRNYFAAASSTDGDNFEIDGIICLSRNDGLTEKQTVFKIHEWIKEKGEKTNQGSYDSDVSGSSFSALCRRDAERAQSLPQNGDSRGSQTTQGCSLTPSSFPVRHVNGASLTPTTSSRKRKATSPRHNSSFMCDSVPMIPDLDRLIAAELNNMRTPEELPVIKLEPQWLDDENDLNCDSSSAVATGQAMGKISEATLNDSVSFLCHHCSGVSGSRDFIEEHIKSTHDAASVFFCVPCAMGFTSEAVHQTHTMLSGCRAHPSLGEQGGVESEVTLGQGIINIEPIFSIGNVTGRPSAEQASQEISDTDCSNAANKLLTTGSSALNRFTETQAQVLDASRVDDDSALDQDRPRVCALCLIKFADFPAFNVHSAQAHSLYPCPYCPLAFPLETQREAHLFEHTGESPLECAQCTLSFSRVDSLERHIARAHRRRGSDEVPRGGDASNRHGAQRGLSRGYNALGLRDWAASQQDLMVALDFVDTSPSSAPMIEISDDEEELGSSPIIDYRRSLEPLRAFCCEICGEGVEGVAAYTEHCAARHRRIPCPYCGGTFTQKASMERHQRQHTGVKPYRCGVCAYSFTRKETLLTHVNRMHTVRDSNPF